MHIGGDKMTKRKYYAEERPTGMSYESFIHSFPSKEARDRYAKDYFNNVRPIKRRDSEKILREEDPTAISGNKKPIEHDVRYGIGKEECERMGGEYVSGYIRNGRRVKAYCRMDSQWKIDSPDLPWRKNYRGR